MKADSAFFKHPMKASLQGLLALFNVIELKISVKYNVRAFAQIDNISLTP